LSIRTEMSRENSRHFDFSKGLIYKQLQKVTLIINDCFVT